MFNRKPFECIEIALKKANGDPFFPHPIPQPPYFDSCS